MCVAPTGPWPDTQRWLNPARRRCCHPLPKWMPDVVLETMERALDDVADLSKVAGNVRRYIVWALEKIAFHPDTFNGGARLLLRLAVAENETWSNNATGLFRGIFPTYLGNTAADGDARLALLDESRILPKRKAVACR